MNAIVYNKFCSKCSYPLTSEAYEEIKENEDMEEKYEREMKAMREEMNQQLSKIMSLIQQNPQLAYVKPEALTKKIEIKQN